jgi:hypothetical protein
MARRAGLDPVTRQRGRARPSLWAHNRHVARVLAGIDDRPAVPWWLTVEQAIAEADRAAEADKGAR